MAVADKRGVVLIEAMFHRHFRGPFAITFGSEVVILPSAFFQDIVVAVFFFVAVVTHAQIEIGRIRDLPFILEIKCVQDSASAIVFVRAAAGIPIDVPPVIHIKTGLREGFAIVVVADRERMVFDVYIFVNIEVIRLARIVGEFARSVPRVQSVRVDDIGCAAGTTEAVVEAIGISEMREELILAIGELQAMDVHIADTVVPEIVIWVNRQNSLIGQFPNAALNRVAVFVVSIGEGIAVVVIVLRAGEGVV